MSTAAGIVAANLPPGKPGENVVVAENEFTSNYFPWLLLRERGYEVRAVAPGGDGLSAEAFAEHADGGTRLIAVSAVHSPNGYRADLAALRRVAARSGAWFFVDACQAAGAVPLDVVRDGVDFLAAASHKFLLGSRGMGYLYVRRGLLERMRPILPGWKAGAERRPRASTDRPWTSRPRRRSSTPRWPGLPRWPSRRRSASSAGSGFAALLDRNARLSRRLQDALARTAPRSGRSPSGTAPPSSPCR